MRTPNEILKLFYLMLFEHLKSNSEVKNNARIAKRMEEEMEHYKN